MKTPSQQLSLLIRTWREDNGFSQAELAELLGMRTQYVAHMESEKARFTFSTAQRLAKVIGPFAIEWKP